MRVLRPTFQIFALAWLTAFLLVVLVSFSDHTGHTHFHHHGDYSSAGHSHDHVPLPPTVPGETPHEHGSDSPQIPNTLVHIDLHHVMMVVELAQLSAPTMMPVPSLEPLAVSQLAKGPPGSIEYPPRRV